MLINVLLILLIFSSSLFFIAFRLKSKIPIMQMQTWVMGLSSSYSLVSECVVLLFSLGTCASPSTFLPVFLPLPGLCLPAVCALIFLPLSQPSVWEVLLPRPVLVPLLCTCVPPCAAWEDVSVSPLQK